MVDVIAGEPSGEWLRIRVGTKPDASYDVAGTTEYFAPAGDQMWSHFVSHVGKAETIDDFSIEIGATAPAVFRALRTAQPVSCVHSVGLHATWGTPTHHRFDREGHDSVKSQRLLSMGLTKAEARVALLVAGGNSARNTAGKLGISLHTTRSTLRNVYSKLGIHKQSELGAMIAQL